MNDTPVPAPLRRSRWPYVLLAIFAVLLVAGGLLWWLIRPIRPVVLTPQEVAVVEAKVAALQTPPAAPVVPPPPGAPEPVYERGKKEIVLTEREINGLLNANTDLGQTLSFQLATDAVLARYETDLDPDLPLLGGRKFKARAKFIVSEASGRPALIIDDLTIWGISLPNEWLGGVKGRNLLAEMLGSENGGRLPGVESFSVRPGQLVIKLAE